MKSTISKNAASTNYDADSISILRGLQAVRKRPGMYIGDCSTVAATHHLLYELFDNAVDEVLAGHADRVEVTLHADGSASVRDNGRGIPVSIHPEEGISAAEVIFTSLHAGGKFDNDAYKFSGGLHGVGSSVVTALSDWLSLEICRDGGLHTARFEDSVTVQPVTQIRKMRKGESTGTLARFKPSSQFLTETKFERDTLEARFQEVALLNGGLKIIFRDERPSEGTNDDTPYEVELHFDGGLIALAEHIAGESPIIGEIAHFQGEHEGVEVEIAFSWLADDRPEDIRAYTNNVPQSDGGQHVTGLRSALSKVLLAYAEREKLLRRGARITPDDLREGMATALHVRVPDPAFSSQTKEKLISIEARTAVDTILSEALPRWLDERPEAARAIIARALASSEAREAARKARELSRSKSGTRRVRSASLPEKLADCSTRLPERREIFLVEGDSAGGSAKQARDRETQAILPLRGKILNVERAKPIQIMKNAEIIAMTQSFGTGIGKNFDLSRLRYGKIVIMTDADVDGAHIATLILTFFFRQMPALVENGHLYLATPPLYRVRRRGEEDLYVQSDAELAACFLSRALSLGAWTIDDAPMEGPGALEALQPLINSAELAAQAALDLGHPALADALLSSPHADRLFSGSAATLSVADGRRLTRDLTLRLREIDPDGQWKLHPPGKAAPEESEVARLLAIRSEDGVESRYELRRENLSSWRVQRIRDAAIAAGLTDSERVSVLGKAVQGPIGLLDALRAAGSRGASVSRYKGLGEMNPEELWATTMDPARRTLRKVTITDLEAADRSFQDLMADSVGARRELIEQMCAGASRLDI